ncbi:MAG: radical SAM protein, partial [Deltaproteobacteria bacterium]|nr:radical SAM protein [Deltaproteobacteria bacterium]
PRLGLPVMAAMLNARGHETKVYVPQLESLLPHTLEILRADLVGISTLTPSAPEAYELARWVRRANRLRSREVPIVLGGPHVTFLPDEGLQHADFVVRGEGEHTILELVQALESGGDLSAVLGLSWHDGETVRHNPDRPLEKDLDALPFADLTTIQGYRKLRHLPIAVSRGCPHDCDFCSVVSMFGRAGRRHSAPAVVRHLEEHVLPIGNRIFFVDDNFAAPPRAAKELLSLLKAHRLGRRMRWYTQVTVHAARDEELLSLMADTNCTQVYVGFESIRPETLRGFHKSQTVESIRDCIRAFHKHGIRVHGMFVIGSDHDDAGTAEATVDFARKHGIDTVQFAILTPMPGTRTFDQLQERLLSRDWGLYDGIHAVYEPTGMTAVELQRSVMEAYRRFYSIPRSISAFLRLRMHTGLLRLWARHFARKALRGELQEYLTHGLAGARPLPGPLTTDR